MRSIGLKTLLYRNLVLLIFLPLLMLMMVIMAIHSSEIRRNIIEENQDLLTAVSGELNDKLDDASHQLTLLSDLCLNAPLLSRNQIQNFLQKAVRQPSLFESISITDHTGKVIAGSRPTVNLENISKLKETFLKAQHTTQPVWSETFISSKTGNPTLTLSLPAKNLIISGNLNLDYLKTVSARIKGIHQMEVAILKNNGEVIGHTNKTYINKDFSRLDIVRQALNGSQGSFRFSYNGRERIGNITKLPATSWMVMVSQDATSSYQPIFRMGEIFLAGLLLSISFVIYAASRSIAGILAPISSLVESTRAIAAGHYQDFSPPYSIYEIDELAKHFQTMAKAIRAREAELNEQNGELIVLEEEQRQQLEENIRHQEELILASNRLEMILSSITEGFYAVNNNGIVTYFNRMAEVLMGHKKESVLGKPLWDVFAGEVGSIFHLKYLEAMSTLQAVSFTALHEGSGRWIESHYYPFDGGLTVIFKDCSKIKAAEEQRKDLEEQLRHSQRMEAIGTLAGGVAHDFNNLLTVIIGCSSLAQRVLMKNEEAALYVDQVIEAGNRAANLTQSLLAFSRKQKIEMAEVDLNQIIEGLENLLHCTVRENISMDFDLNKGPLNIFADKGQLEQVIINLVANARDSMPAGGRILLSTRKGKSLILSPNSGNLEETPCAILEVADTGTGIDDRIKERIFDPFYTTKEIGKGTGLGLSMAYGIISQHNGLIEVNSEPGRTVFTISLPTISSAAIKTTGERENFKSGGNETILLVEDEPAVRNATCAILKCEGYNVISSGNGREAVEIYRDSAGQIDLVLMDVIMPVMNGKDAFLEIRRLSPDVPIIFTSGYAADILKTEGVDRMLVLEKPVLPDYLLMIIRKTLDSRSSSEEILV